MFAESSYSDRNGVAPAAPSPRLSTSSSRRDRTASRSRRRPVSRALGASLALGLLATATTLPAGATPAPTNEALPTLSTAFERKTRVVDLLPASRTMDSFGFDFSALLAAPAGETAAPPAVQTLTEPATDAAAAPVSEAPPAEAPVEPAPEPAPLAPEAVAVWSALSRIGMPYVWGASGPNSFDCSGLTMWAWGNAGVGLGHYTGSQYAQTQRISEAELQPGDLVFYYSPVSHVGMYIGNGQIVNAENPSVGVKITGVNSMPYAGAVRPG